MAQKVIRPLYFGRRGSPAIAIETGDNAVSITDPVIHTQDSHQHTTRGSYFTAICASFGEATSCTSSLFRYKQVRQKGLALTHTATEIRLSGRIWIYISERSEIQFYRHGWHWRNQSQIALTSCDSMIASISAISHLGLPEAQKDPVPLLK